MQFGTYDILRIAAYDAYIDFRRDFSRSAFGTFWNSIGVAAATAILGTFFGAILQTNLPEPKIYIPFVALGVICWSFAAGSMNRSCSFVRSRLPVLRQISHPFPAIPIAVFIKSSGLLVQNLVIAAILYWLLIGPPTVLIWHSLFGVLLLSLNVLWLSLLVALAAARFRDFPQILSAGLYVTFLVTPILWMEHFVGRFTPVVEINPAYHLISIIRMPSLGVIPPISSWLWALTLLAIGALVTTIVYRSVAKKIPYWL